jgi:hypothetical protein
MPSFGPELEVNDVVQVVAVSRLNEQIGLNVFHYRVVAVMAAGSNALSRITDAIQANGVAASLKLLMTSQASFLGFTVQRLHPAKSPTFPVTEEAGPGTAGATANARQVAGFIRKKSAVAGRRLSGRMYIPFPSTADDTGAGIPTDDYKEKLDALAIRMTNELIWGPGGGQGQASPVIYQRPRPPLPYSTRSILSWIAAAKWATQRRRGSFGRPNVSPFGA